MWLSQVRVSGFRNLASQVLEFDPRANVLFGPNGSGKTNLLEAVSVLASGRSFRTIQDSRLLAFDAPHFSVAGSARTSRDKEYRARVYFSPAERKHYFVDKTEVPKRALFTGWLPVSVFLLDDRRVVAGPPAQRRWFLDEAVSKVSRTYRFILAEFRQILAQRNALLKRGGGDQEFEVWEDKLAEQASQLSKRRGEYWQRFAKNFQAVISRFIPERRLSLAYREDVPPEDDYRKVLASSRDSERRYGFTRSGPHRDDFAILLEGKPLRHYGSWGEQRLAALALSLAEAQTAFQSGRRPVFLMDDVAAELDKENTRELFSLVSSQGQVFYAAALPPPVQGKRFHVQEGKIRQA